jgi:hypothetical protein
VVPSFNKGRIASRRMQDGALLCELRYLILKKYDLDVHATMSHGPYL